MLSLGLLRQIWSCGSCPAPEEGDGKRRVFHQHLLPVVFQAWISRRLNNGARGLLLHHDNASVNTATAFLDYLEALGWSPTPIFSRPSSLLFLTL